MEAKIITLKSEDDPYLKNLINRLSTVSNGFFNPITIFKGTDGRGGGKRIRTDMTGPGYSISSSSHFAIADSHMRAWDESFANNYSSKSVAFFEDDFVIREEDEINFDLRLQGAISDASDVDILYLGCFSSILFSIPIALVGGMRPKWIKPKSEPGNFTSSPSVALGLHAYILTSSGAYKLLEILKGNIETYIDYEIQFLYAQSRINILAASPRLVFQTSTASKQDRDAVKRSLEKRGETASTSSSSTSSQSFPIILSEILDRINVDKYVSAKYLATVEAFSISNDLKVTPIMILLFVFGVFLAMELMKNKNKNKFLLEKVALVYIVLVSPDLKKGKYISIIFGAFLLLGPALVIEVSKNK